MNLVKVVSKTAFSKMAKVGVNAKGWDDYMEIGTKYYLCRFINRCIPEGPFKVFLRQTFLNYRASVPREFLINNGEVATIVGSPNTKTIERMSKSIGTSGRIILIEPNPTNLENHYAYIELHKLKNVTVIPKAAYNKKGKAKFLVAPNPGDHRLVIPEIEHDNDYRRKNYYLKEIAIEVDIVDNIMGELNIDHLNYVEVAVNGAEMYVLQGMENVLSVTQRLFVKGHARYKETKKTLSEEIIPFLEKRGFHTKRTLPSASVARTLDWGERQGDVFAWRSL